MTNADTKSRRPVTRCHCGKRISRNSHECAACHKARMDECRAKAREIVTTGKCPDCGTALVLNSSMEGWWQCGAYASGTFRRPEFRGLPKCHFQAFTA